MKALLIIDVQRCMCEGQWAAYEIDRVIERINGVSGRARAAGALVVVIQHEAADGFMDYGSEGWQLARQLLVGDADVRVRKTACDSFHKTELQSILAARGVSELVLCGLQTEYCVDTTMRRALALGYPVTLMTDGHSTMDNGVLTAPQIIAHHNRTLGSLDNFGPRITSSVAADIRF